MNCVCTWHDGKVTSLCGAHHEAAYRMYGERLEKLEKKKASPGEVENALKSLETAVKNLEQVVLKK